MFKLKIFFLLAAIALACVNATPIEKFVPSETAPAVQEELIESTPIEETSGIEETIAHEEAVNLSGTGGGQETETIATEEVPQAAETWTGEVETPIEHQTVAEAEVAAQAEAQAESEAIAQAEAESEAIAQAQAESEATAQAQAEAESEAIAQAQAEAESEAIAQAQAESESIAQAQAEAESERAHHIEEIETAEAPSQENIAAPVSETEIETTPRETLTSSVEQHQHDQYERLDEPTRQEWDERAAHMEMEEEEQRHREIEESRHYGVVPLTGTDRFEPETTSPSYQELDVSSALIDRLHVIDNLIEETRDLLEKGKELDELLIEGKKFLAEHKPKTETIVKLAGNYAKYNNDRRYDNNRRYENDRRYDNNRRYDNDRRYDNRNYGNNDNYNGYNGEENGQRVYDAYDREAYPEKYQKENYSRNYHLDYRPDENYYADQYKSMNKLNNYLGQLKNNRYEKVTSRY